jgi:enamine deaminase RidA (YjgF/YER057c/UK114 family)
MLKRFNPEGVPAPLTAYSHGVVVPEGWKQLHVAGQVGAEPDGTIPDDPGRQAELCFANVLAVLAAESMGPQNMVSLTTYVVGPENLLPVRNAFVAALGDVMPASTLVFVQALANPRLKVEIQAVAAGIV